MFTAARIYKTNIRTRAKNNIFFAKFLPPNSQSSTKLLKSRITLKLSINSEQIEKVFFRSRFENTHTTNIHTYV